MAVIINNKKQSTRSVVPTVTSILDSGVGIGTARGTAAGAGASGQYRNFNHPTTCAQLLKRMRNFTCRRIS